MVQHLPTVELVAMVEDLADVLPVDREAKALLDTTVAVDGAVVAPVLRVWVEAVRR